MPRPKSGKAYEPFNCRVPQGLTARLSAYAELHSQRVRDVVAEALLAYLEGTHVAPVETPAAHVIRQAQQRIAEGLKLLGTVHAPRRAATGTSAASVTPQSDSNGEGVTLHPDGMPAYDPEKYYLGRLCPGAHDWNGTGQTLKRVHGNKCDICNNEGKKKRREAQHQAIEVS